MLPQYILKDSFSLVLYFIQHPHRQDRQQVTCIQNYAYLLTVLCLKSKIFDTIKALKFHY